MNSIRTSPIALVLALALLIFVSGCKSSKKAREAAAAKAKQEQELALRKQKEAEAEMKRLEEEKARLLREQEEEERRLREKQTKTEVTTREGKVESYFASIANATSVASANSSINEALTLFASPEVPVLIVISEAGGQKDYDRPTTIRNYLNYLKDQKKNINAISSLKVDDAGKITELELRKNL